MIENKSVTFSENQKLKKQCAGLGLIGWIAMIPVVLIIILVLAVCFFEGRKAYWDHKVREMCEKDGGMEIYERVNLDEKEYRLYIDSLGNFTIPREDKAPENLKIISKYISTYIHRNNPEVRRFELQIIRRSDNRLLGTMISYGRAGGDLVAFHPSIYSCPEKSENLFTAVVNKVKN